MLCVLDRTKYIVGAKNLPGTFCCYWKFAEDCGRREQDPHPGEHGRVRGEPGYGGGGHASGGGVCSGKAGADIQTILFLLGTFFLKLNFPSNFFSTSSST